MANTSTQSNEQISFSPLIIGTMRLGSWGSNLDTQQLENFIDACVDMGLCDFDHADIYGHYTEEERFGEVLKRRSDLKNKVQITTKCGIRLVCDNRPEHKIKSYDASRKHILQSAENSLRYLGVDCLDLLLIHRPDYLMNPHEIAEAFETLRSSGKVKTFGVSNFTPSQFDLLNSFTPLVTNQIEVSLFQRSAFEDGTLDQCIRHNISPTAWSPYGGGAIFASETAPEYQAIKKVLEELGETYGASADQLLLAFLCKHPAGIIPILGSSKIHRIESAKAALDIHLSHEDWYRLWEAALGEEVA